MSRPHTPSPLVQAIAAHLGPAHLGPAVPAAFILDDTRVFFTRAPRCPHEPRSAVIDLLQALHGCFPGQARRMTRKRIYSDCTSAAKTALDRAAVQVFGSKFSPDVAAVSSPKRLALANLEWIDLTGKAEDVRRKASAGCVLNLPANALTSCAEGEDTEEKEIHLKRLVLGLVPMTAQQGPPVSRPLRNRAIAAVLVDEAGKPLLATQNTNGLNRTLHAEVNLLQLWWAQHGCQPPEGSSLVTSLQPCRFCSALLMETLHPPRQDSQLVLYAEPDPGRLAQQTLLQNLKWQRQL